jgi:IMP dehydrogenase
MPRKIITEPSRTLMEFRLLPQLTTSLTKTNAISLQTQLAFNPLTGKTTHLNIPIMSAAMQAVSGVKMAIELAKVGGVGFIYCSQPIADQAAMIAEIKQHKAGFVKPKTIDPDVLLSDFHKIRLKTGYNTFPVVDKSGAFLGLIGKNDYDIKPHGNMMVKERMIPRKDIVTSNHANNLKQANAALMESHQSVLPVLGENDKLLYLVFRKDIHDHLDNPQQVVDDKKRLLTAAAINTHDYRERLPALAEAGVDIVSIDSSDGYTTFQQETLQWCASNFPGIPVIGGNIVTAEGFQFLVDNGASAIKVGMGSGSICITQEQKGTGRGLATAIIKTVAQRDLYYQQSGKYIPIIADGGIGNSKDISVALALGADAVMMGRYFARMEEAPTEKVTINKRIMKPYWGEGSNRARDWKQQRYNQSQFIEGVEGFVEYAGRLKDNIEITLSKITSTMSTCGVATINELHENAELEVVSSLSIREGKVHDIFIPDNSEYIGDNDLY